MPEAASPESLIGRVVFFFWQRHNWKSIRLQGKIIGQGREPGTVIIRAGQHYVPTRIKYSGKAKRYERLSTRGALHSRPISEIEVLA